MTKEEFYFNYPKLQLTGKYAVSQLYIKSLEQQNTALQARIKDQTKTLNEYADTIYKQAKHIEEIEKEYQEFGG